MPITRTEGSAVTKCHCIFTVTIEHHYISAVGLLNGLFVWFSFRLATLHTKREHTWPTHISRTIYGTVPPAAR